MARTVSSSCHELSSRPPAHIVSSEDTKRTVDLPHGASGSQRAGRLVTAEDADISWVLGFRGSCFRVGVLAEASAPCRIICVLADCDHERV
eukprot:CAMPEP_0181189260 /NCGR_PEP_ID=MMETSP1096-20121128/11567_1 /TAXON_ID=156174 ORGANISM="Chrysochromulina ericina, Strain CCMP281" /NCGR_SAMPLE_ID=MMETSP1096 /ASSEMBLY_ACC=CAM_ASM_000453 /LENGTH=90 /DNA_ID=CAMNT_0023278401 /DNA_START=115 /DNA_END=387 /DNA_ORIENTATION=-